MVSMKCFTGNELEDKQLLAYLDNEADQETLQHLEQCAYCLERANALARLHDQLTENLYRVTCPSSLELGEYHLHVLPASQMMIISQHIRTCPHCAGEIEHLKKFLSEPMPDQGGREIIAKLVGGITKRGKPGAAVLSPALAALRGEGKEPIAFEADGIVIVMDIHPGDEGRITIQGQVAADDQDSWTGAAVELYQDNQLEISTTLDDLGTFQIKGLLPGLKDMQIKPKSGSVVIVPSFEISI